MIKARGSSTGILLVMLLIVLAVTLLAAFLLTSSNDRTATFYLSLFAVMAAEVGLSAWPIAQAVSPIESKTPSFALGLGMQTVFGIYACGVVVLALIERFIHPSGDETISHWFKILVVLHGMWAAALMLTLLSWKQSARYVNAIAQEKSDNSVTYQSFRVALRTFSDRVSLDDNESLDDFTQRLKKLSDDTRYFPSDTPKSTGETYDAKLMTTLDSLLIAYATQRDALSQTSRDQHVESDGSVSDVQRPKPLPSVNGLTRMLSEIEALLNQRGDAVMNAR